MITISPGHDSLNPGAVRWYYQEHKLMEALAGRICLECSLLGLDTVLIDQDAFLEHRNYNRCLNERIRAINEINPDYHFSLHMNATEDEWQEDIRGLEILVYDFKNVFTEMNIIQNVIHTGGLTTIIPFRHWTPRKDIAVLRDTECKAFLFECGFINNHKDVKAMLNDMDVWVDFFVEVIERLERRR